MDNEKSVNGLISHINVDLPFCQFHIATEDVALVNHLRRAIIGEIPTYAIDIIIFYYNISPLHDELLALRLGQLVIDHTQFQPEENEHRISFEVFGPKEDSDDFNYYFTTDDIPLPFKFKTEILELRKGQHIKADCIVRSGIGSDHAKFKAVATAYFDNDPNGGYTFGFKSRQGLDPIDIIQKAILYLPDAVNKPPNNGFTITSKPISYKF